MRTLATTVLIAGLFAAGCDRPANGSANSASNDLAASAASGKSNELQPGAAAAGVGTGQAEWREVTIPAGTTLPVVLETPVGSDISRIEEPVHARLARPIQIGGVTALAEGSTVSGVVTDATRSGKVKGLAHVAVRFDTVSPRGNDERYRIQAASVSRTAQATKKNDAVKILAPAAGGALIGRIAGGRKGAAIGAAAGGGAGTAYVMSTRGKEVRLQKGAELTLRLAEPVTVKVRT